MQGASGTDALLQARQKIFRPAFVMMELHRIKGVA
jgi:hypothetical protein